MWPPETMLRAVAACVVLFLTTPAGAAQLGIDRVEAKGLGTTELATLIELLPRDPPAIYTDSELAEFERRVRNLELFDRVDITVEQRVLRVDVGRKENVEPEFDFASGATAADTAVGLGATHHDVDGKASKFGIYAGYAERFAQFELELHQHDYRARKWSWEMAAGYGGSEVRFEDVGSQWIRGRLGAKLEVRPPFSYVTPLRVEFSAGSYLERSLFAEGPGAPRGGQVVLGMARLFLDRWTFHDLVPHGFLGTLVVYPGTLFSPTGSSQPRHQAGLELLAAQPLGLRTVLATRAVAEWVNTGNPNHSLLMGSQRGVRGLADTLYRDRAHAFINVELRHAFDLGKRWYLQPALFADAARFQSMDVRGQPTDVRSAVSIGGGLRILPTALIDTLLRVDVARLVYPEKRWFFQIGIDQYF